MEKNWLLEHAKNGAERDSLRNMYHGAIEFIISEDNRCSDHEKLQEITRLTNELNIAIEYTWEV